MKKILLVIGLFLIISLFAPEIWGQETKKDDAEAKKAKLKELVKDKKFMKRVWKNVKKLDKKYRQTKVERAEAVAGVRGEAKDETLSDEMYYKGGEKYPHRNEVRDAVEMLSKLAGDKEVKGNEKAEVYYFLSQCYVQLNDNENAKIYLNKIIEDHSKSEYASEARELLGTLQ